MILKLDFEKAFDSVKWSFLQKVLQGFGFGNKWRGWLEAILTTTRLSVLVNGSPSSEFGISRGLRKRDPLSPVLFIMLSEVLHLLLGKASEVVLITCICLGKGSLLSHVFFANDTTIFINDSWESCWGLS